MDSGSIGEQLDLEIGDKLVAINGNEINDLIDYQLYAHGEELVLDIEKNNGELWDLELERDADDPLGLGFEHPVLRQCSNNCQFCFVRQLPTGLRKSLYVRDDDYRFSYLYGAYITLTNLSESDMTRIIEQRLSPLYVSVHATDIAVRSTLLGRSLSPVMPTLKRLVEAGIELHTQIVLCPDINDASCLDQTIAELSTLFPGVLSLAVVPVGLTGHRHALPVLRAFSCDEAQRVIEQIHCWQRKLLDQYGTRFVFAADEFYLQGECSFPDLDCYEDLAQIENGVGLIPLFRRDAQEVLKEVESYPGLTATLVTGESAAQELCSFVDQFNQKTGSRLTVKVVYNHFFSGHVSVVGLLTGKDIIEQLRDYNCGRILILPDVVCREGEDVLLDDVSLEQISDALNVEVAKVSATPWGIFEFVDFLASAPDEGGNGAI
ncbi:MAG: DUF512 domain-containing protein [Desulfuromonas sp.]|nr:DUF512 domain-containing protein [Desulfuromonas sp.]